MRAKWLGVAVAAVMAGWAGGAAQAAVVVTFAEVGSDVNVVGGGTLDVTGLVNSRGGNTASSGLRGDPAFFGTGDGVYTNSYSRFQNSGSISGPEQFGSGDYITKPSSSTGDTFALAGLFNVLFVSPTFQSGDSLSFSDTYLGQTFASLGVNEGTFVYTLPNDTVTFVIGSGVSNVPLPASAPMFGAALLGLAAVGYGARRKRVA